MRLRLSRVTEVEVFGVGMNANHIDKTIKEDLKIRKDFSILGYSHRYDSKPTSRDGLIDSDDTCMTPRLYHVDIETSREYSCNDQHLLRLDQLLLNIDFIGLLC